MNQKYAAYDAGGTGLALYDAVDSPVPQGVAAIKITDEQWQACLASPGYTILNGVLVPPPSPTDEQVLAAAQSTQIAALTTAYQAEIQQPVAFTTEGGVSQTFQADSGSQNVLLVATTGYNLAGTTPEGFYWVASDNAQVSFTLADLKGLYAAMLAQGNAAFTKLQNLKAAVRAATTVAGVQGIDWS
jgi:hypothetical protein